MPSLASIFPFLEAVHPETSSTWHISRARQLGDYVPAWIAFNQSNKEMSLISFTGTPSSDGLRLASEDGTAFILLLLPRTWVMPGIDDRMLAICDNLIASGWSGMIVDKAGFDQPCESHTTYLLSLMLRESFIMFYDRWAAPTLSHYLDLLGNLGPGRDSTY